MRNTDQYVSKLASQWKGQAFTHENASKTEFIKSCQAAEGVIHLYTHASGDSIDQFNSWIAFNDNSGHQKLFLNELLSLQLNNRLTVLQGCETGLGPYYGGEGITSLSWAFMLAGSPTTVQTLWTTNNSSTAEIMQDYFQGLYQGDLSSESLSRAKQQYIRSDQHEDWTKHPYYWAGITLTGNDFSFSESGLTLWLVLFLCVSGLLMLAWYIRWNRAQRLGSDK